MPSLSQWSALAVLCLLCTQPAHGQAAECGGDYVCIADDPAAMIAWADKRGAELRAQPPFDLVASGKLQPCVDTPVNVTAVSDGERGLLCSRLPPNPVASSKAGHGGGIATDHSEDF